jgi:hypothetical protein
MHHDDRIRVVYPHGGRHVLLRWWTEDEQGHVIIAPTKHSAHTTALRLFEKHTDAEIKDYCEIEIVAPSLGMQERNAARQLAERVFMFHHEVASALHDVVAAGHALPPFFAPCETYVPCGDDADPDEWAREKHYDCQFCVEKIKLVGMTPEGMYSRWYEPWREAHHTPQHVDVKKVLSRAVPVADAGEPALFYARHAFGPHNAGIELAPWEEHSLGNDVLFFFRRGRDLDRTSLQAVCDGAKASAERWHEEWEADRIAARVRFEREAIETTLVFFKKESPSHG